MDAPLEAEKEALRKALVENARAFLQPPYGAACCLQCQLPLDMTRAGFAFRVFCSAGCSEVIFETLEDGRLALRMLRAQTPLGPLKVIVN